jgi:hypothetical protein
MQGGPNFPLPDLRSRFCAAERRDAAVGAGADRILCFLIEDTAEILSGVNFSRLWQF